MRDLKIYSGIIGVLLVFYLVAAYHQPKATDWKQNLYPTEKSPFGTYILYNRIHDIFPGAAIKNFRDPIYNSLTEHGPQHGLYLIIANSVEIDEYDYNKLLKFVNDGNQVFIAATSFGGYMEKKLKFDTGQSFDQAEPLHFSNPRLDSTNVFSTDKSTGINYFTEIDTASTTVLAQNGQHRAVFVKIPLGKGEIYLNANPLMFTNYALLQYKGGQFASQSLSYLKPINTILWDEYYTRGHENDESVMRVFLNYYTLKYAFYIALFSLLLFVIYEMKRRQRIIPIADPVTNSSVDFVKTVGRVYYEQRDNLNIAQKKFNYFLEYIRARYGLKTNELNKEFITMLSQKSGVDRPLVQTIVDQAVIAKIDNKVTDQQLIDINRNIEQFYIQSS